MHLFYLRRDEYQEKALLGRKSPGQLLENGLGLDLLWVIRAEECWKSLPQGHNL